jgi:hypothetical protein
MPRMTSAASRTFAAGTVENRDSTSCHGSRPDPVVAVGSSAPRFKRVWSKAMLRSQASRSRAPYSPSTAYQVTGGGGVRGSVSGAAA